ncbi:ACT domain-containing protein [Abyssibius alkaniclasticus]|uniref:ACT domain-containing protein n=1 Tax=Abyssibius alkaniclasticus TaxID=2881234 RepID=UPI002364A1B9|nr:ACT domain-containing protein [Abyssibius alkaniclasticus]UPH71422.1 ACT domain-containing protein [Abyssibius alkaniclasticus]
MTGERNLAKLLASMAPALHAQPYGFAHCANLPAITPFATVAEDEGLTVVAPLADLQAAGLKAEPFARISLSVHSALEAVGLTAAMSGALAQAGVSANVIAGYFHDHVFVAWNDRNRAMQILEKISRDEQAKEG